jgi:hypothetical protein
MITIYKKCFSIILSVISGLFIIFWHHQFITGLSPFLTGFFIAAFALLFIANLILISSIPVGRQLLLSALIIAILLAFLATVFVDRNVVITNGTRKYYSYKV